MDINFDCPACGGSLVAEERLIGESITCPHCSKWIRVPANGEKDLSLPLANVRNALHPVLEQELSATRFQIRKAKVEYAHLESLYRQSEKERLRFLEGRANPDASVDAAVGNPTQRLHIGQDHIELSAQLEEAHKMIAQLQTELENAQSAMKKDRDELAAKGRTALQALEKARQDLAVSEKQLNEMRIEQAKEISKQSRERVRIETLEEERDKSLSDLINERREAKEIKTQLAMLQHRETETQKAAQETERKLDALAQEKTALTCVKNKCLEDRKKAVEDLEKALEQVAELQRITKEYEQRLAAANHDQEHVKAALEKVSVDLERLSVERETLIKERNQAHTSLSRYQGQLDALRMSHEELKSAHEDVQNDLRNAMSSSDRGSEHLEEVLEQMHENLEAVMKEISGHRAKTTTARLCSTSSRIFGEERRSFPAQKDAG